MAVGQHCAACTSGRPEAGEPGQIAYRVRSAARATDERTYGKRPSWLFLLICAIFIGLCVAMAGPGDNLGSSDFALRALAIGIVIAGAVIGVALHEWAHAAVAYRGGDRSVIDKGYLTLDPRHYSDPLLSIGLPLLFLLLGGLPLPGGAVWINHAALRSRVWASAVSAAGPAMTALFGLLLVLVTQSGLTGQSLTLNGTLLFLAFIQFALALFNLLPIPGLDGYGIIEPFLPISVQEALMPVRQFTFLILLVLIFSGDSLAFLWQAAGDATIGLGANPLALSVGAEISSPQIRGL